eukprot:2206190-Rhodomonas_salina.4
MTSICIRVPVDDQSSVTPSLPPRLRLSEPLSRAQAEHGHRRRTRRIRNVAVHCPSAVLALLPHRQPELRSSAPGPPSPFPPSLSLLKFHHSPTSKQDHQHRFDVRGLPAPFPSILPLPVHTRCRLAHHCQWSLVAHNPKPTRDLQSPQHCTLQHPRCSDQMKSTGMEPQ